MDTSYVEWQFPESCVDFSSDEGKILFKEALGYGYMNIFFHLGPQLLIQSDPAYSGFSCLVMLLNALEVDPGQVWKGVWRWYHENMLSSSCCQPSDQISAKGVSMTQLMCVAKSNQLDGEKVFADQLAVVDDLRHTVMESCKGNGSGIISSFRRPETFEDATRFATIGGYHPEEDCVLLLEPASFKNTMLWTPLTLLWQDMKTVDENGKSGGYLVLRKSRRKPSLLPMSKCFCVSSPFNSSVTEYFRSVNSFLQQKVDDGLHNDEVIQKISDELIRLSGASDDATLNLLLARMSAKVAALDRLSPEHQHMVRDLVAAIEDTHAYRTLLATRPHGGVRGTSKRNAQADGLMEEAGNSEEASKRNDIVAGSSCCSSLHLTTLLLHIVPAFAVSRHPDPATYLAAVEQCLREDALEHDDDLANNNNLDTLISKAMTADDDVTMSRIARGRHLLRVEVASLQAEICRFLDDMKGKDDDAAFSSTSLC